MGDEDRKDGTTSKRGSRHWLTAAIRAGGASRANAVKVLRHALVTSGGRTDEAAQILGVSEVTLWRLLTAARMKAEAWDIRARAREAAREKKTTRKLKYSYSFLLSRTAPRDFEVERKLARGVQAA